MRDERGRRWHISIKDNTIALILSAEGLMWTCQYVITKFNQTEIAGFPDGNTYDTREDAETAALSKAKFLIDESALSSNLKNNLS